VLPLLLVAGGILLFTRDTWSGGGCDEQIVAGREPPSTDTLGLAEVVIVSSSGSVSPITGDWVAVQPSFSPAGDEVVVVRAEGDYESSGPDHSELWVVGAEGLHVNDTSGRWASLLDIAAVTTPAPGDACR
jgi:hypothetical protein